MAERQFCTFYLDDTLYGIDILVVSEIYRNLEMTKVHEVPSYVRGLLNLRGQIVTVLDLGERLGLGAREISKETRSIILKTDSEIADKSTELSEKVSLGNHVIGLLVDKIGEVVTVDETGIEVLPANINNIEAKYLNGVVKLQSELLSIIRVKEIIN